jgi:ATP-dependent protease ClpP protease subunit
MERRKHPSPLDIKGRSITLMGEIGWDFSAQQFIELLQTMGKDEPIELIIMSEGGTVVEANAIYDFVRVEGYNVNTTVYGYAASAATVLALCGKRVRMGSSSVWMVHSPYYMEYVEPAILPMPEDEETEYEGGYKKPKMNGEMEGTWVKRIEPTLQLIVADIYARKTGGTREEMIALMEEGDRTGKLYNAEETLALGFIDEVLTDATSQAAAFINQFQNSTNVMTLLSRMAALFGRKEAETTEDVVIADLQNKLGEIAEIKASLAAIVAKMETNDPGDTQPEPTGDDADSTDTADNAELVSIKAQVAELAAANQLLAGELASIKAKGPVSEPKANGVDLKGETPQMSQQERIAALWAQMQNK